MASAQLTFDSEPGVGGGVASAVGGGTLEHARVLSPHVVDYQGPVVGDGVSHGLDAVQRLAVSIPGDLRLRSALHIAGNLQLLPYLTQSLKAQLPRQPWLLCKEIK